MNQHPYLRAYMAGIVFPTVLLLIWLTLFCIYRYAFLMPLPIERAIIFPMAVVPNVFGLWNILFIKLHQHWRLPIGLHGAVLPLLLGPVGVAFMSAMGFLEITGRGLIYFGAFRIPYWYVAVAPFIALTVYYLIWKYIVGFLNRVLGIAD